MKIAHIAPFAPCRAGIYEAARDIARADIISGNEVYFIDAGITVNDKREQPVVGVIDDRLGFKLITAHPDNIKSADIIVLHTGIPNEWIPKEKPIIWVIHARPLAAFRMEQNKNVNSFFYPKIMNQSQVKKIIYFWPEFKSYWNIVMPEDKMHIFDYPVVDQFRFNPHGEKHIVNKENLGEFNGLICDSWREDVDLYEVVCGAIEAAKNIPGLKWHLYAFDNPIKECWQYLINELRKIGALGELCPRMSNMEKVYRGFDFLLTPHRIATRVICEALSCGMPVIASNGCRVAQETADIQNPYNVAEAVKKMIDNLEIYKKNALEESKKFDLINFGIQMNNVYRGVINV